MAITTRAQLTAAIRGGQKVVIDRTASGANLGVGVWSSIFNTASNNSLGVLAGTSTTQGVVPDDTTAGFPGIDSFNGQTGYLAQIEISGGQVSTGARFRFADLLFKSGAHNFNAADTLASQPSYAARLPNTDYTQAEIWIENVTAFTGTPSIAITYTSDTGAAGQAAVVTSPTVLGANCLTRVALAPGDRGVQKIESVTSTVATVGTFNVLVMRVLAANLKNVGEARGMPVSNFVPDLTALPQVFDTSALYYMFGADGAGSFLPHGVKFLIARG